MFRRDGETTLTADRAREHHPVEGAFRVRYSTLDQLVVAYSADLSKGGMFLASDQPLPVNSTIRLQLELPDGGGERTILCRIVYIRDQATAERTGKTPGMGVQFLDLDEEALSQIGRFIAERSVDAIDKPRPSRTQPLNVLVVDDDLSSREAAAKPFRDRGDNVRTACDGVDALAACLKDPPDVILCDVQMPRMDGWQLVRIVRSRPQLDQVPMLFLTRLRGEDERLKGYQLGVDDFVPKPSRPEELVVRVERVVARLKRPMRGAEAAPKSEVVIAQKTLRGDIEQVSLPSVLSFLELEKKTGILSLFGAHTAKIHIDAGRPLKVEIDGSSPTRTSRQRLEEVLDWSQGQFEFSTAQVACQDEVRSSLTSILLDHARVNDESAR
ncbi:MAG TPA: response regulator [Polyangiaceae bacterium]|nr:response regulator [Polyangiaceae bacterium]